MTVFVNIFYKDKKNRGSSSEVDQMKKVVVAVVAAGCFLQTADAFVSSSAMLGVKPPVLRAASAVRPRSVGLCTVNMGTFSACVATRDIMERTHVHAFQHLHILLTSMANACICLCTSVTRHRSNAQLRSYTYM